MATKKTTTASTGKTKKTAKTAPKKAVRTTTRVKAVKQAKPATKPATKPKVVKTAPKKGPAKPAPTKSAAGKLKAAANTVSVKKAPTRNVKTKAGSKTTSVTTTSPVMGFEPYKLAKGENYMSPGMRDHFRLLLLKWKRDLMEEVDRTVGHMKKDAANFADPADRATQEEEFSLELRTRDRERKLIRKIDEALTRIDLNEFGYCETCGIEIGLRRLEARPTAELCIDCKTLQEIKERQMA